MITKEVIRNENAMHMVSGYSLILHCCECLETEQEIATEGRDCYAQARRIAKKSGWVIHQDGYSTCKKCLEKTKAFQVVITQQGSEKAKPAIWYAGMAYYNFLVVKSKKWPTVYEVIEGKYKGNIIDPKDCKIAPKKD